MPTFVFYAHMPNTRRADGCNTVVTQGQNEASARSSAEALLGEVTGSLAEFTAIELSDVSPGFVVAGHPPVGTISQNVWPTLTRGGDTMKGA